MEPISLDVSDLPAPEPFDKIMAALAALKKDQYLWITHRKQPMLLYKPLQDLGFNFHVQPGKSQPFEIFIWADGLNTPPGIKPPNLAIPCTTTAKCNDK